MFLPTHWLFYVISAVIFPDKFEIISLGKNINTKYDELAPVFSADGKTLFFCREGHPDNVGIRTKVDEAPILTDDQDIWMSRSDADGNWGPAVHIEAPFNTVSYDFPIGASPNGKTLYIGNIYLRSGEVKPGVSKSIYANGARAFPVPLNIRELYNEAKLVNYSVSVDEKIIILNFQRSDSVGELDIYVSFLGHDQTWSEPKNLGSDINSKYKEVTPFLGADNKTLYFASSRPGGEGGFDMYVSRRLDESWQNWTPVINLGTKINTAGNDIGLVISPSGYDAVYSRETRKGGKDLFSVHLPQTLRPEESVLKARKGKTK
jgi:OmpA-OmpF porin, OOP family